MSDRADDSDQGHEKSRLIGLAEMELRLEASIRRPEPHRTDWKKPAEMLRRVHVGDPKERMVRKGDINTITWSVIKQVQHVDLVLSMLATRFNIT